MPRNYGAGISRHQEQKSQTAGGMSDFTRQVVGYTPVVEEVGEQESYQNNGNGSKNEGNLTDDNVRAKTCCPSPNAQLLKESSASVVSQ